MTITQQDELEGLKKDQPDRREYPAAMSSAMEPGLTTREPDSIGQESLSRKGAVSAPQAIYDLLGTTCISVNEEIAHNIPVSAGLPPGIWSTSTDPPL